MRFQQKPYNYYADASVIATRLYNKECRDLNNDEEAAVLAEVIRVGKVPQDILAMPIKVGDWICSAMTCGDNSQQTIGVVVAIDAYKGIQVEQRFRTNQPCVGGKKVWLKETSRMINLETNFANVLRGETNVKQVITMDCYELDNIVQEKLGWKTMNSSRSVYAAMIPIMILMLMVN